MQKEPESGCLVAIVSLGEDHGLWIKGLGEMLCLQRTGMPVWRQSVQRVRQSSSLVLGLGLAHGKGVSEGQSRLNFTDCQEQAPQTQGHIHPPVACPRRHHDASVLAVHITCPVRAGSAQLALANVRMDDQPFHCQLAYCLGPPRPLLAFTQQFSHVPSLTSLPCLQSHASCARARPPPLGAGRECCSCSACAV